MRRLIAWLRSWATTLRIMFFERDTYRLLRDYSDRGFVEDDFEEASEPGAACSWCGGEWYLQECDDPIQCCDPRCDGTWHPCTACNGTGLAKHQTIW